MLLYNQVDTLGYLLQILKLYLSSSHTLHYPQLILDDMIHLIEDTNNVVQFSLDNSL